LFVLDRSIFSVEGIFVFGGEYGGKTYVTHQAMAALTDPLNAFPKFLISEQEIPL